jgi:molecular chaperone GrpE
MAVNRDPHDPADPADEPHRPTAAEIDAATADGSPTPVTPETIAELAAERDRSLRLRAELENVRTRTARELAHERRYAAVPLVRDLLPVIDNMDRAIEAAQKNQNVDAASLLEGFRMVRQQLSAMLERNNCTMIDPMGEAFDPQHHEAILHQPSASVPANHVTMVTQPGYQIHDRVVRPAQVIVSSGPAAG